MINKRKKLIELIKELAIKEPKNSIPVPDKLKGFGSIKWTPSKCTFCNKCVEICPEDALASFKFLNLQKILTFEGSPEDINAVNRRIFYTLLKSLAVKIPEESVQVPKELEGYGSIVFYLENCTACNKCVEICPEDALQLYPEFNLPEIFKKSERGDLIA
ncbi:MAG: ATP-binding protein [Candidatus Odinarchaeia archaeon]